MSASDKSTPDEVVLPPRRSFFEWLNSEKARKIVVWAGLLGMLLLLLSVLFDNSADTVEADAPVTDYAAEMETKLHELLLCVEGVSDCRVMVTLESGSRVVYANGGREPMTECEPTVRGVVVVIDGAIEEQTEEEVKRVVKTALHLAEKRVCVVVNSTNQTRKGEQ